jgi:hypothetical protein
VQPAWDFEMKPNFSVRVSNFTLLDEISGSWQIADYQSLLTELDYGDVSEIESGELRDMCLMSLQDLGPEGAAAVLLRYRLGDQLSKGQIDNISHEMLDEKMWEEYVNESLHEQMFVIGSFLYAAFPNIFPEPDAVQVHLEVIAENAAAREELRQSNDETFVVRLLADGMDTTSTLRRLFETELAGGSFAKADTLIWIVQTESVDERTTNISVISSGYWLDALRETKTYTSHAFADEN